MRSSSIEVAIKAWGLPAATAVFDVEAAFLCITEGVKGTTRQRHVFGRIQWRLIAALLIQLKLTLNLAPWKHSFCCCRYRYCAAVPATDGYFVTAKSLTKFQSQLRGLSSQWLAPAGYSSLWLVVRNVRRDKYSGLL